MMSNIQRIITIYVFLFWAAALFAEESISLARTASTLPDLSGLVWLQQDLFIGVHDAKNPDETGRPRLSLIRLPRDLEGITWRPLKIAWPEPLGKSSDLESASGIPAESRILFAESGDDGGSFHRIFLASFDPNKGLTLMISSTGPVLFSMLRQSRLEKSTATLFSFMLKDPTEIRLCKFDGQNCTLVPPLEWVRFARSVLQPRPQRDRTRVP